MPVEFVGIDRDTPYMLPLNTQDCLPDNHLVRFRPVNAELTYLLFALSEPVREGGTEIVGKF